MNKCKVCKEVSITTLSDLLFKKPICSKCFSSFKVLNKVYSFENKEMTCLYEYEDFGKELLFQFKGLHDLALSTVFTYMFKSFLKRKYRNYVFYCIPSNIKDDEKRGFNHVEEIARSISTKVYKPFRKTQDWKQSDKSFKERGNIKNIIEYSPLPYKKVVLIDDIVTTGSTLRACIRHFSSETDIKILTIFKKM